MGCVPSTPDQSPKSQPTKEPSTQRNEERKKELLGSEEIVKILESLPEGQLFFDPDFGLTEESLFYTKSRRENMKWARPKDIVPKGRLPYLLVDGINRKDIMQGILADCCFLSSCAAVSQREKIMKKIVPDDNPLFGAGYKGCVHFRFWRFGEWLDVYIDDNLPVVDGNQLIFSRCEDETEFWVPLIEKAYAKLHGSYEAMEGGQPMDSLVDLTGGLAEILPVTGVDINMYRHLLRAHKSGTFITCAIKGDWKDPDNMKENGLISGHAYAITKVMKIKHKKGEDRLLRIRNPWGDANEWTGTWSDGDSNWDWVDEKTKELMEVGSSPDGEFWMTYEDFCAHFQEVTLCTNGPDFDGDGIPDKGQLISIKGKWSAETAGGSRQDFKKFATNPQYILSLTEPDDFNPLTDEPESEGSCSVVIALMQECTQDGSKRKRLQIAFHIYKVNTDDPDNRLSSRYLRMNYDVGNSGSYINLREVSGRFEFVPGHYILIPSTFLPQEQGHFLLRVFTQKEFIIKEQVLKKVKIALHLYS